MYFETSTECKTDKINHETTVQKYPDIFTTLQKYSKSYVSTEKLQSVL
jgi:hypothetical protein